MSLTRRQFLTAVAASTITLQTALIPTLPVDRSGELSILLLQHGGDETTYRGYNRIIVPRNSATWQVLNNLVTNRITMEFPECIGNNQELTGFGICIDGEPVALGHLTAPLHIASGIIPSFAPGNLPMEFDHAHK